MAVKINISSKEFVKPSSPTKDPFKKYQLSLLDHLTPHFFVPLVFYYKYHHENGKHNRDIFSSRLKESLSDALTLFYPLAGRLKKGESSVDCNDKGVLYLEADVLDSKITDLIEDCHEAKLLDGLIPFMGIEGSQNGEDLMRIQINYFNCGGIAIGACFSHKIADAFSFVSFMTSWAELSSKGNTIVRPSFDSSSLFPPPHEKYLLGDNNSQRDDEVWEERLVSKRFIYDPNLIAYLRANATNDHGEPSRVEAISAFIWKHASGDKHAIKLYIASHSVNLRTRMVPRVAEHSFGNQIGLAFGEFYYDHEEDSNNVANVAAMALRIRESIRRVDDGYITWIREEDAYATIVRNVEKIGEQIARKEAELFNFSSWCRFPVYEVDFGMGKPVWVSLGSLNKKNCAILMDSKCGKGVEAWVTMSEKDFTQFQMAFTEVVNVCSYG